MRADAAAKPLNLFYVAADLGRASRRDRLPWRLARRLAPASFRPSGQTRAFLNLVAGLRALGIPHRVNDHAHARAHPEELCCLVGKRRVMTARAWENPLLVGPCVFDHPLDCPELLERWAVRRLLVPGEWMRAMCEPHWGGLVRAWPAGIDTALWSPPEDGAERDLDVLVYEKVLWDREAALPRLLEPVLAELRRRRLRHAVVRYGTYEPEAYLALLRRSRSMVFLSEHETQGLACQEALSAGVPVAAWETGSFWKDPKYYPHRVAFSPVTSVPWWDERCGVRFDAPGRIAAALDELEEKRASGALDPRGWVLENLTLERCAASFAEHAREAESLGESAGGAVS